MSDLGELVLKVLDWLWRDGEGERGELGWRTYGYACAITPVYESTVIDKPVCSVDVFDGV